MDQQALHQFYEYALLPQFGFTRGPGFIWHKSVKIGPDETAHHFSRTNADGTDDYVLIYEDFQGLGRVEAYVREHVELRGRDFEYIPAMSPPDISPSLRLDVPTPSQYAPNVLGTFTLIRLI